MPAWVLVVYRPPAALFCSNIIVSPFGVWVLYEYYVFHDCMVEPSLSRPRYINNYPSAIEKFSAARMEDINCRNDPWNTGCLIGIPIIIPYNKGQYNPLHNLNDLVILCQGMKGLMLRQWLEPVAKLKQCCFCGMGVASRAKHSRT